MRQFIGYLLLMLATAPASAELLPRVDAEIRIDGDLSDPLWRQALRVEKFYDIRGGANSEPPVRTVGWIAYDSRFLYIAIRAEDPDPRRIRAPLVPRDRVYGEQDLAQIDIDAQDDGKSSTIFRVNARGVQTDGVYTESNELDDYAPDFDYESATRITKDAWQAEMRIPLASLRYAQRDPQAWRIVFYRVYPRDHRYQIRSSPVRKGETCWLCSAPRYEGVTGLSSARDLVVTPYTTAAWSRSPDSAAEESTDAGADAKWLPRPSLSVDATLRPDFSQVESDVSQLTVNHRFAVFYPEKRPFFMEGSDLLSSPIQAINTRTVTSPLWGTRITGRPGNHAFTLIAAGDRGGGSTIVPGPVESSFDPQPEAMTLLGRYRYSLGQSSAGLLLTSRSGDEQWNRVIGPDLVWWPRLSDRITAQLLWSDTKDPATRSKTDHATILAWNRTSTHLAWNLSFQDIGRDFRADSGFVPQTGVRTSYAYTAATAYPGHGLSKLVAAVTWEDVQEIGGGLVSRALYPTFTVDGWRATVASLSLHPAEKVRTSNGAIASQDYATLSWRLFPSRRFPFLDLSARFGDEADIETGLVGKGTSYTAFGRLQPVAPLYVELTAENHRLEIHGRRHFDASSLNAALTWAFTPRSFARVIGDGQRVTWGDGRKEGFLDATFLYGYRVNWQTSLYVGYGDSRLVNAHGGLGSPRREMFVKASYAVRSSGGSKQ